jgi:hypothetical protein
MTWRSDIELKHLERTSVKTHLDTILIFIKSRWRNIVKFPARTVVPEDKLVPAEHFGFCFWRILNLLYVGREFNSVHALYPLTFKIAFYYLRKH